MPSKKEEGKHLLASGLSPQEVAEALNVSISTVYTWRKEFTSLYAADDLTPVAYESLFALLRELKDVVEEAREAVALTALIAGELKILAEKFKEIEHLPAELTAITEIEQRRREKFEKSLFLKNGSGWELNRYLEQPDTLPQLITVLSKGDRSARVVRFRKWLRRQLPKNGVEVSTNPDKSLSIGTMPDNVAALIQTIKEQIDV
jgi:hypothetical protein